MQKKLESILEHQLAIRVTISREIRVFSKKQLAEGFGMSIATLHRYTSPAYRELSRETARKALMRYKAEDRSKCHTCKHEISEHMRCMDCSCLLHDAIQGRCQSCFDSSIRAKVRTHQFT